MRILLPPSETKRDGGDAEARLDLNALSFPALHAQRRAAFAAMARLARNAEQMRTALKLGATQQHEVIRNRTLRSSPVLPAVDRYTGVLYDGLDAAGLGTGAREAVGRTVVIHSALFGLIGADDRIPAYRLSHDGRLPGCTLKSLWQRTITDQLGDLDGLVLDLRSASYAALGPLPSGGERYRVEVVADAGDGTVRALNHFNKRGKGRFVRVLAESGAEHPDIESLLDWAEGSGIRLRRSGPGVLELIVDQVPGARREGPA